MKDKPEPNPVGRPTKVTPEVILKLEQAFSIGCNDLQACAYSEISTQTYYSFLKKQPEFLDRVKALKERPLLKAKKTVFDNLNDPANARWYLEKKQRDEFGVQVPSMEGQFSDEEGKPLFQVTLTQKEPRNDNP